MYLLIPIPPIYNIIPLSYLHSTMYLLIPAISLFRKCFGHLFTFHYVSINSQRGMCTYQIEVNLHSTMYLLILYPRTFNEYLMYNLHSTMYLLILIYRFQSNKYQLHLHSTMYLLILKMKFLFVRVELIYIPLCIY